MIPVYETADWRVVALRLRDEPSLAAELGQRRADAFGSGEYSIDDYDGLATQIVAFDRATNEMAAAMRIGFGDELLVHGWEAFYLSHFWTADESGREFFRDVVEVGRVWIRDGATANPIGMVHALYGGVAAAAAARRKDYAGFCGTLSMVGYPDACVRRIAAYFEAHHPADPMAVRAIDAAPGDDAEGCAASFRALYADLRRNFPNHPLPFLLHIYVKHGVRLLGDCALSRRDDKFLLPLFIPMDAYQRSVHGA